MLPGDSRAGWHGGGLTDGRVFHFWDERKVVGDWFARHVTHSQFTEWDVYFLYGPHAGWEAEPSPLISSGGPVVGKMRQLEAHLLP